MSKNLNKIVAFAIGISVISGNVLPAMASNKVDTETMTNIQTQASTEKKVLTLDDAIEGAKSVSKTIAILDENIRLKQTINSLSDRKDDVINDNDDSKAGLTDSQKDYNEDLRKLELSQLEQKRDFAIDKLKQDVTDSYNGLILSQLNIDKLKKDIELQKREIEQYNLKSSLGLLIDVDIDKVNISLQKNLNDLTSKENTLKDDKYNFKVLTGKDVDDYLLEDNVNYTKLEIAGDLDDYLDGLIDEYVSYTQEINDLKKDFIYDDDDENEVTNADVSNAKKHYENSKGENGKNPTLNDYLAGKETPEEKINAIAEYLDKSQEYSSALSTYTQVLGARMSYLQSKSSVTTNDLNLKETKDQYKKLLRTMYTNLVDIENSIDLINANIQLTNKQLRITKVNYDLGLVTKLQYDKSVNESETLNIQLKTTVNSYNTLKAKLEKPWIAFS